MGLLSNPIVRWLEKTRPPPQFPLCDFERICYEVKPCDVLLIEGRSRVSDVIKTITQSTWSHAALYVGRLHDIEDPELRQIVQSHFSGEEDARLVIESLLGKGTVVRDIRVYKDDHIRICRPSRLAYRDVQKVMRYAISRLGVEYDVRQILDLARFLFPWSFLPRRWRSSLFTANPGRSTRTVCSTMIAESFSFVDFPILPLVKPVGGDEESHDGRPKFQLFKRNPKLFTPRDFDYSPYFDIIKYPFVDFHHGSDYRLLPWHGDAALTEEEMTMYMQSHQADEAAVDAAIKDAVKSEFEPKKATETDEKNDG